MTPAIILVSVLVVVLVAVVVSLYGRSCNRADNNLSRRIQLLEQKLILENKLASAEL